MERAVRGYSRKVTSQDHSATETGARGIPPRGMTAMGVFLFFGATMALLAGTTLVLPGTVLDRVWVLNTRAYAQLAPLGRAVGSLFLLLSAALAAAGTGWFRRRAWGWWLTVAIIATQICGDLVNAFLGDFLRGGVGVVIAGGLFFYLISPPVRTSFGVGAQPIPR